MNPPNYPRPIVAAVQAAPAYFDLNKCISKLRYYTAKAKNSGAGLVVFSESFIPGFPSWVHLLAPVDQHELFKKFAQNSIEIPGPAFQQLQEIARDNQVFLSLGITEKATKQSLGLLWNTNLIFDPEGNLIARHRKLLPTWSDKLIWSFGDGSTLNVHDTEIGRIGALICGENTNSLAKYALISQGEQIHISTYPACFPTSRHPSKEQSYFDTLMVRACSMSYEGKVFTVVSSQALDAEGYEILSDGRKDLRDLLDELTYGASFIVSPSGVIISDIIKDNQEGIALAECDLAEIVTGKSIHDIVGNYQRNDIFKFEINKAVLSPVSIRGDESAGQSKEFYPCILPEDISADL